MENTKPFYAHFRKSFIADLRESTCLKETGVSQILYDLVKYSFAGEPRTPAKDMGPHLEKLIAPDHAICHI